MSKKKKIFTEKEKIENYKRKHRKNYVYFIQSEINGYIKIGKSYNPKGRLISLQGSSPVKLKLLKTIDGGIYLEYILHTYFGKYRHHGEWFKPNSKLNRFVYGKELISIQKIFDKTNNKIGRTKRNYLRRLIKKNRIYL